MQRIIYSLIAVFTIAVAGDSVAAGEEFGTIETSGVAPFSLEHKFSLKSPYPICALAWSPDGSALAISSNYGTIVNTYSLSGARIGQFQTTGNKVGMVRSIAFGYGSALIWVPVEDFAGADAALDARDAAKGTVMKTITRTASESFNPNMTSLFALSPDQKRMAMSASMGKEVVIFGTDTGKEWHQISSVKPFYGAASLLFFPDNKTLAVGEGMGTVAIVDTSAGAITREFATYDKSYGNFSIDALAISPSQDMLLTGAGEGITSNNVTFNRVNIWHLPEGLRAHTYADTKQIFQAAWDPQNRFVAFVDTDSLTITQLDSTPYVFHVTYPYQMSALALTRDGNFLAVAGGNYVTVYTLQHY